MIYVRRDASLIPAPLLERAMRAQATLETLTPAERREFIKSKAAIWREFSYYLSLMSYEKCWYSESPDAHSFFDVDHFRPKLEAKRSDSETSAGYEWLAFSWENFRYAANCSNRLNENLETGIVEGKGSWFPLIEGSEMASWDDRCEIREKPILLDPVVKSDVRLVDVSADGRIVPSRYAIGTNQIRVTESCKYYGLNLPRIKGARSTVIREVVGLLEVLGKIIDAGNAPAIPAEGADMLPLDQQIEIIQRKALPNRPYSKAVRAVLLREGYGALCPSPEENEDDVAAARQN